MTRESAIKQLKRMKIDMSHTGDEYNAIVEAIRALEQVPTDDATLRYIFCMGCEYKEQEPKTGHWIHHEEKMFISAEHWECSWCHRTTMI